MNWKTGVFVFVQWFISAQASSYACDVKSSFTPFSTNVVQVGSALNITSNSTNATSLTWIVNGLYYSSNATIDISTLPENTGVYQVQLIARNGTCSDTAQCTFVVTGTPPADSVFKIGMGQEAVQATPKGLTPTADSGFVVLAQIPPQGSVEEGRRVYVIKLSRTGCIQWSRQLYRISLASPNTDVYSVQQTKDGGFIVLGYSQEISGNSSRIVSYLVKLDRNGNFQWEKSIWATQLEGVFYNIAEMPDGYALAGLANNNITVVKLDLQGNFLWNRYFSFGTYHQLSGLVYQAGGIIFTGYFTPTNTSSFYTSFAVRLDADKGLTLWSKKYNYSNYLVFTELNALGDKMVLTMKCTDGLLYAGMDANGLLSNIRQINVNYNVGAQEYSVRPVDENYLMVFLRGTEPLPLQPYYAYWSFVAKMSWTGDFVWTRKMPGHTGDYFTHAVVSAEKSFGMLGLSVRHLERVFKYNQNLTLVKVTPNGTTPSCYFEPHQMSTSPASIVAAELTPLLDSSLGYATAVIKRIVERPYTESIYDCPGYYQGCNTVVIGKFDTVCNIRKVHMLKYNKGRGCASPVALQYDSRDIEVISQTDSIVRFRFLHYGEAKLKMSLTGPCSSTVDSITLVSVDRSISGFTLGPDFTICNGITKTLSAGSGFSSYLWQDGSTAASYTVTAPGDYFVLVQDTCGNSYNDAVRVTPSESVPIDAGPDRVTCNGDSLTLTAPTGFATYSWQPDYNIVRAQTASPAIFPAKDTAYILTVKNVQGCKGFDTIRIKVYQAPPIHLGKDTVLCSSQKLLLNAGSGFTGYAWNTGSTAASLLVSQAGEYSVSAREAHGCTSRDTIKIFMQQTPVFSLGNDTALCEGKTLLLSPAIAGTYIWQNGSMQTRQLVTAAGLYWLEAASNGCLYRDSIKVSYKPVPVIYLGSDTTICEGSEKLLAVSGAFSGIMWQDNSTASTYTVSKPGTYSVKIDLNGCVSSDTITILQKLKPRFSLGKDTLLCAGQSFVLRTNLQQVSYLWSNSSTASTFDVISPGTYSLTSTNECGSYTDQIVVGSGVCTIQMPTAFTPNHDQVNDVFGVKYPQLIKTMVLKVFNRSGQLVFTSTDPAKGWNGTVNGQPQDTGNFVWTLAYEMQDGTKGKIKGSVLLIK